MEQRHGKFVPKMRSKVFASWIRTTRQRRRMSQLQAAQKTHITPQDWSRMEREGLIPLNDLLKRVCSALNYPISEALSVIERSTTGIAPTPDEILYGAYKASIVEQERTLGVVGIFILREDPEPVDYVAVGEYLDVLTRTKATSFTLLFRYPDPNVWRSVHQLTGTIAQKNPEDAGSILPRIRGFYRHPEYAENGYAGLPMAHPYVLTSSQKGVGLSSFIFDETTKQRELAAGYDEAQAAQRSICIIEQSRPIADRIANWIGLSNPFEPLPQLWVPIEV